jgi:membrane-associated phospholipid phosphatase
LAVVVLALAALRLERPE